MLCLLIFTTLSPACLSAVANPDSESSLAVLRSDTALSSEGYFVLSWELTNTPSELILQQSDNRSFSQSNLSRTWSVGSAGSLTITGREDGDYYYRLVASGEPVSEVTQVTVAHHSLQRAGLVFFTGLMLFAVLIVTILIGNRQDHGDV